MTKMEIELSDTAAAVIAEMAKRGQVNPGAIARVSVETSLSQVIDRSIAVDGESVFLSHVRDANRVCREVWGEVLKPGIYAAALGRPCSAGPETRRLLSPEPSNPDLLRVELPDGYMVWNVNGQFRKILRPIARQFGVSIEGFLHLYSANKLANQPPLTRRLDESDMPEGFSVNLGTDKRALERIQRAAEFSGHTIESMAWQSIGGFVDCCEDDMIFHPVTGKPVGDEVEFGRFLVSTHRFQLAA